MRSRLALRTSDSVSGQTCLFIWNPDDTWNASLFSRLYEDSWVTWRKPPCLLLIPGAAGLTLSPDSVERWGSESWPQDSAWIWGVTDGAAAGSSCYKTNTQMVATLWTNLFMVRSVRQLPSDLYWPTVIQQLMISLPGKKFRWRFRFVWTSSLLYT